MSFLENRRRGGRPSFRVRDGYFVALRRDTWRFLASYWRVLVQRSGACLNSHNLIGVRGCVGAAAISESFLLYFCNIEDFRRMSFSSDWPFRERSLAVYPLSVPNETFPAALLASSRVKAAGGSLTCCPSELCISYTSCLKDNNSRHRHRIFATCCSSLFIYPVTCL